jgi:hypothetical protein
LSLSSTIPPSPDQAQAFANAVGPRLTAEHRDRRRGRQLAGRDRGARGRAGRARGRRRRSEQRDLLVLSNRRIHVLRARLRPRSGQPRDRSADLLRPGTSQAAAFAAAVLVALMSYDPSLSYSAAETLLVSTAVDGHLDATAAFDAAGLQAIVAEGNANIPQATTTATPSTQSPTATSTATLSVKKARWAGGKLTLLVSGLGSDRLAVQLEYRHAKSRNVSTTSSRT